MTTIGSPSDSRFLRPRLPPELQLMVLDAAKHDPNTLSACSMATKAWFPTSRAHLFREVFLVANRHTAHRFTDFLKFIRELPTSGLGSDIAQCIVVLEFDGELVDLSPGIDPEDEDHDALREFYVPVAFDTIRALASALPRLQELSFHFILFYDDNHLGHDSWWSPPAPVTDTTGAGVVSPLPEPEDDASGSALPSIRCLGVYQCSAPDDDLRLLIYVLSLFASIKQLVIESGSWMITTELDQVLDTLPTSNLPDIDGLQLTDAGPDCTEALGEILQELASQGSHMRSLVLGPESYIEDLFESCLPVLTSAHLRKLTLNVFHLVESIPAATPLPWSLILPTLPGLTSLNLNLSCHLFGSEEITKEMRSDAITNGVRVYASILDFAAALNRVPSLHTVSFAVFDGVIAPSVFRRSARTSKTAVWKALGDALVALPSLGEVQFVLRNTSEPVTEEWVPSEITKKKMNSFLEEVLPQLAGKAAGKEQLGPRYRVMLESEEEDEPWRCHD